MADKSNEIIKFIIDSSIQHLENLKTAGLDARYTLGEKIAYVEILEIIQRSDKENKFGLDFNIEEKYPVD